MFSHVIPPLIHGVWTAFQSIWWLLLILLGCKYGPRIVRGILLQRGGLQ